MEHRGDLYTTTNGNEIQRERSPKHFRGRYWILEFFDWLEPGEGVAADEDEEPATRARYTVVSEHKDFIKAKEDVHCLDDPLVLFDVVSLTAQKWDPGKGEWGGWDL